MRYRGFLLVLIVGAVLAGGLSACGGEEPPRPPAGDDPAESGPGPAGKPLQGPGTVAKAQADPPPGPEGDAPGSEEPGSEEPGSQESGEEFRVPQDWCGTGRMNGPVGPPSGPTSLVIKIRDGEPIQIHVPRGGGWKQTGRDGVWERRVLKKKPEGHWAWVAEYARWTGTEWETWGEAKERKRREREAAAGGK